MSSLFHKIKEKATIHHHHGSGKAGTREQQPQTQPSQTQSASNEPTYSIQPHPAKSEDPRDLEPPQLGAGLNSNPEYRALHARDPHVPNQEILNNITEPAVPREELRARQEELNKQ